MVLTSTIHVAPHICGYISSIVIYLVQVELQMVLISTVSIFFLSSLSSSFSCLNLVHEDPARSLRLRPLPCKQQQPHSESCKGANKQFLRAAAGSNGLLRAARGGERAPGVAEMVPKNALVVPPSPPLPLALVLRTSNNTTLSRKGAKNSEWTAASRGRPDRTACCAAGPRKAAAARSSSS